jgi:hypothetical protein
LPLILVQSPDAIAGAGQCGWALGGCKQRGDLHGARLGNESISLQAEELFTGGGNRLAITGDSDRLDVIVRQAIGDGKEAANQLQMSASRVGERSRIRSSRCAVQLGCGKQYEKSKAAAQEQGRCGFGVHGIQNLPLGRMSQATFSVLGFRRGRSRSAPAEKPGFKGFCLAGFLFKFDGWFEATKS